LNVGMRVLVADHVMQGDYVELNSSQSLLSSKYSVPQRYQ
jgi:hypothetical protein